MSATCWLLAVGLVVLALNLLLAGLWLGRYGPGGPRAASTAPGRHPAGSWRRLGPLGGQQRPARGALPQPSDRPPQPPPAPRRSSGRYQSSGRPASDLAPPPTGSAPGADRK